MADMATWASESKESLDNKSRTEASVGLPTLNKPRARGTVFLRGASQYCMKWLRVLMAMSVPMSSLKAMRAIPNTAAI